MPDSIFRTGLGRHSNYNLLISQLSFLFNFHTYPFQIPPLSLTYPTLKSNLSLTPLTYPNQYTQLNLQHIPTTYPSFLKPLSSRFVLNSNF